ncbi:MAG: ABC transporter permease subunit [Planctomycetota bacterium]
MPLHDVGYRGWEGEKTSDRNRWWIIATTGVQLAFRSTWLSRTLVLSWVPAIVVGVLFFIYEQSIVNPGMREVVQGMVFAAGTSGVGGELAEQVMLDPESARHEVWSSLVLIFFRYPQAVLMLLVVAIVSTRLISADLRNRGYLLYFSRPLTPSTYILGKAFVVWAFMAMIITLPALSLYCVGLALSPDWKVIFDTWDLPLRIALASAVLMVPVSSVALACSALTSETRYAVFSWFSFWVVGWVSYWVMYFAETQRLMSQMGPPSGGRDFRAMQADITEKLRYTNWEIISPFHVLGRVQQYVFGLYPEDKPIWHFITVLVLVTLCSFWFVRRQILSRLRA